MAAPNLTPRTESVTIFQGDDQSKLDKLAERVDELRNADESDVQLLSDPSGWVEAAQEHDALLVEATDRAVVVTLRPLGRKTFRALVDAHPPRPGNEADEATGVNVTPFAEDLVPASIVSPEMTNDEKEAFLDSVTDAQFDRLYSVSFWLNRDLSAAPKAIAPSSLSQSGAES